MKNLKKVLSMFLLILFVAILLPTNTNQVQASTPKLNKSAITIEKGSTYNLKVKNTSKKIKWMSSNKKIATVSSNGKVKAKKAGEVIITATINSKSYTCKVTVTNKVKLNKTKVTVQKGNTYTLKLQNNKKKIKWTSSNKKIATVSSSGKITAKKVGTCKVYAKVGKKKYTCKVTVKEIQPKLNVTSITINKHNTYQLKLNNNKNKIKWSSSNKNVATVNKNGKVTAKESGTCKIYANVGNKKYSCKITVTNILTVLYDNDDLTIYLDKIAPFTDNSCNTGIYLKVKNKMKTSISVHFESISINGECASHINQFDTISPNSTQIINVETIFDNTIVDPSNIRLKNLSGSFYYYIQNTKEMIDKEFSVEIE